MLIYSKLAYHVRSVQYESSTPNGYNRTPEGYNGADRRVKGLTVDLSLGSVRLPRLGGEGAKKGAAGVRGELDDTYVEEGDPGRSLLLYVV